MIAPSWSRLRQTPSSVVTPPPSNPTASPNLITTYPCYHHHTSFALLHRNRGCLAFSSSPNDHHWTAQSKPSPRLWPPWSPTPLSAMPAAIGDSHGRHRLRQSCLPLPRNRTCMRCLQSSRLSPQTLDGSWLVGVLYAPHMFEPASALSTIPKMPLTISWVFD